MIDGKGGGAAEVFVCESRGWWARLIRRGLAPWNHSVVETRAVEACSVLLRRSPASILAIEFQPEDARQLLPALVDLRAAFGRAVILALGTRAIERYRVVLHESGALAVFVSAQQVPQIVRIVRRHYAAAAPRSGSLRGEVLARLPWPPA